MADPARIRSLLAAAGLAEVVVKSQAGEILLGGGGKLGDAVEFLRQGAWGRAVLAGADEAARDRAVAAVREALAPHVTTEGALIGATAWLVTARRQRARR